MSGKWAHLKGVYPERVNGDEGYEARVASYQELVAQCNYSIPRLADEFMQLRGLKEEHEAAITELNVKLEATQRQLMERLEAQGLTSAETSSGQKLAIRVEVYPAVTDPEAFTAHLWATPDLDYLRKPHPASLAAYVRGLLEDGKDAEVPPGVSVFLKTTVGVKKA